MTADPARSLPRLFLGVLGLLAVALVPRLALAAQNGKITFGGIKVMNPDGTDVQQLGPAVGGLDPDWSRDGTKLAFQVNQDGIWIMDGDGSNQHRIVSGATLCCPSLSPDASQVAVGTTDSKEIRIYDVGTGMLVRTFAAPASVFYASPSWSPLGDRIAISLADATFIYDDPNDPNDFPVAIPKIDIAVLPVGGGAPTILRDEPIVFDQNGKPTTGPRDHWPDWTSDASTIVCERGGGIATFVVDGGAFIQLTPQRNDFHAGGGKMFPSWSPDAKQIVFQDDQPDGEGIYVMDADGANLHRVGPAGIGLRPDWQPLPQEDTLRLRFDPKRIDQFGIDQFEIGSDGYQRSTAIAVITDRDDNPRAGVDVRLRPNVLVDPIQTANPRNVICEVNGARLWPGRIGATLDFLEKPELTTDSAGQIRVHVLAGTQVGGEWLLDAEEVDDDGITDGQVLKLVGPAASPQLQATQLLTGLTTQLAVGRFTLSPRGTTEQKQEHLLEWLGQLRWTAHQEAAFEPVLAQVEFGPIHTATGRAGIVFYAGRQSPNPLLQYMLGGGSPGNPANYVVLDTEALQGANLDDNTPHLVLSGELPTLAEWEAAVGSKALPGRFPSVISVIDEDLTYFGYPYPPPGGIPAAGADRGRFDRCIPLPGLSATVHSPVNLLFTDANGDSFGVDAAGTPHFDAPGVMANANGENPSGYVVPIGVYMVTLSGTDKGKAFLTFQSRDGGTGEIVDFTLKVKKGATGTLLIGPGGPAPELTFAGKTVPATAHGMGKEARTCTAGKKKCVAKKLLGLLKCHGAAAKKGVLDPTCLAKVRAKFDGGADPAKACFAKLEAKGGCLTEHDTAALETRVDESVAGLVAALDPAAPSGASANKCLAAKLKCVAGRNAAFLGCHVKAEKTGALDGACIGKAVIKYTACFTKADAKGGCLTNGDAGALGGASNAVVRGLVCDLDPLRQLVACN